MMHHKIKPSSTEEGSGGPSLSSPLKTGEINPKFFPALKIFSRPRPQVTWVLQGKQAHGKKIRKCRAMSMLDGIILSMPVIGKHRSPATEFSSFMPSLKACVQVAKASLPSVGLVPSMALLHLKTHRLYASHCCGELNCLTSWGHPTKMQNAP